jgi:hypothetical protein
MSTVYFALVETADGTGTAKPIWTTVTPSYCGSYGVTFANA